MRGGAYFFEPRTLCNFQSFPHTAPAGSHGLPGAGLLRGSRITTLALQLG